MVRDEYSELELCNDDLEFLWQLKLSDENVSVMMTDEEAPRIRIYNSVLPTDESNVRALNLLIASWDDNEVIDLMEEP